MTSSFAELGLALPLARAAEAAGLVTPTPIQAQALPPLIEGRDLLGLAQTGTGKTAAFVLPILQRLRSLGSRAAPMTARALILAPTRELAIQIHETIKTLSKDQHFSHASVYGGVSINPQIAALRKGVDLLVATPGRLNDLLKQRCLTLEAIRFFVLDEADRMLDMGFIRDIRRILPLLPKDRQSMLFSATMPAAIGEIAGGLLRDPVTVEVRPQQIAVDRIEQRLVRLPQRAKRDALLALVSPREGTRALIFSRTKHGANRVADFLESYGCKVVAIHGNKSQGARQRALAAFKSGEAKILVATDIAARGIDVANVSHVINVDLPDEPESYVHRIGRTARAGRDGVAITLCEPSENDKLRAVERLIKRSIPLMTIEGLDLNAAGAGEKSAPASRPPRQRQDRRPSRGAAFQGEARAARNGASGDQKSNAGRRSPEVGRDGSDRRPFDKNARPRAERSRGAARPEHAPQRRDRPENASRQAASPDQARPRPPRSGKPFRRSGPQA